MTSPTLRPTPDTDPNENLAFSEDKATPTANLIAPPKRFWSVFLSTFITIFLAELGDKTQVTTLLMSAESHQPWVVFTGAALALITTSLLGVLVGQWLAKRISPETLDTLAAVILLLITVGLVADLFGA